MQRNRACAAVPTWAGAPRGRRHPKGTQRPSAPSHSQPSLGTRHLPPSESCRPGRACAQRSSLGAVRFDAFPPSQPHNTPANGWVRCQRPAQCLQAGLEAAGAFEAAVSAGRWRHVGSQPACSPPERAPALSRACVERRKARGRRWRTPHRSIACAWPPSGHPLAAPEGSTPPAGSRGGGIWGAAVGAGVPPPSSRPSGHERHGAVPASALHRRWLPACLPAC